MKCLIMAGKKDSRQWSRNDNALLAPLLGLPVLERIIRTTLEAGADEFYVSVDNPNGPVRGFLDGLSRRLDVPITLVTHEDGAKNASPAVTIGKRFQKPFLLLRPDRIFDSAIARKLMQVSLRDGEAALAVDARIDDPAGAHPDDLLKTEDDRVRNIGGGSKDFNGRDTGVWLCTPGAFDALENDAGRQARQTVWSQLAAALCSQQRLQAVDVTGLDWAILDGPGSSRQAENILLARLRDKTNDGPVARRLNRPLSVRITRHLANYRISPNQISMFAFLCGALAGGLFVCGGYPLLLLGGILAQFASIIDGCDGEVARLKYQTSDYGGWFDAVLDRYADAFLLFGLLWHAYAEQPSGLVLWTGFMAVTGSFLLSYTADKYDSLMLRRLHDSNPFRLGRDSRVFLIFLGCLVNQAYWTLAVIALLMNAETLRRIIICGSHEPRRIRQT
ncbi:MAG: CDP-alcohol phosphatidyltransferase family protein [Nitrospinales bacterium]